MSDESDRRHNQRRLVYMGAEIESEEGKHRNALTRDASENGLMLLTRAQLEIGSVVRVRVFAPHDDARQWKVSGRVVRKEPLDQSESTLWRMKVAIALDAPEPELAAYMKQLADAQDELYGRK